MNEKRWEFMVENRSEIIYPQETPPGVVLEKNYYVTMRDGIKIALDVYKPAVNSGPWPAILGIAPYRKEQLWEVGNVEFYVTKGYVIVVAQARGTGLSEGKYNFGDETEQKDSYDIVEWVAKQPWCDGNVGMMGCSYLAMSQYYTAKQKPPHLKCIVPVNGMTDVYRNCAYIGGVFDFAFVPIWTITTIKDCTWPNNVPKKEPPRDWLGDLFYNNEDGPYYFIRSADYFLDEIEVPTFFIVGAHVFMHTTSELNSWSKIKTSKKLMVFPDVPIPYMMFVDMNLGMNQQILKWFDYWLKGINTGIMDEPPVVIYDNGTNKWRYENEYPLARTEWTKIYLHQNPKGNADRSPWGLLSREEPTEEERPDKLYLTLLEVGNRLFSGLNLMPEGGGMIFDVDIPFSGEQSFLGYASLPLTRDLTVWGPLSSTLYGSAETDDTSSWAWYVKIGDMSPDGNIKIWTFGNLKASFREVDKNKSKPGQPWHPFQNPVILEPKTIYDFQVEIQPLFLTFKKGHRIFVKISCAESSFDNDTRFDRPVVPGSVHAKIKLFHDQKHPSHVLLPIIPAVPEIKQVKSPISDIYWGGPTINYGILEQNLYNALKGNIYGIIEEKKETQQYKKLLKKFNAIVNIGLQMDKGFHLWFHLLFNEGEINLKRGKLEDDYNLALLATPKDMMYYAKGEKSLFHMLLRKNRYGARKLQIKKGTRGQILGKLLKLSKILVMN
jgi:predicted acyl esterase